jgi:DNA-binding NarL/FixJ family response regulator
MNEVGNAAPVTAVLLTAATAAGPVPHTAAVLTHCGVELLGTVDGAGVLDLVTARAPDVVVAELNGCPDTLGAVEVIVTVSPRTPVLTLTCSADHTVVLAAVRAGATSHLVMPADAELADAVRRTARGETVFSRGLADVVLEEFGRPADEREDTRQLTEREADVLRLIVDGLTARQIASRLVLSPRTVENHVQNVLRKLRLRSRAALVRYAIENGHA